MTYLAYLHLPQAALIFNEPSNVETKSPPSLRSIISFDRHARHFRVYLHPARSRTRRLDATPVQRNISVSLITSKRLGFCCRLPSHDRLYGMATTNIKWADSVVVVRNGGKCCPMSRLTIRGANTSGTITSCYCCIISHVRCFVDAVIQVRCA